MQESRQKRKIPQFTVQEKIDEIKRELGERKRVYGGTISKAKSIAEQTKLRKKLGKQYKIMEEILHEYQAKQPQQKELWQHSEKTKK